MYQIHYPLPIPTTHTSYSISTLLFTTTHNRIASIHTTQIKKKKKSVPKRHNQTTKEDEPQRVVGQSPLPRLQYPLHQKSSTIAYNTQDIQSLFKQSHRPSNGTTHIINHIHDKSTSHAIIVHSSIVSDLEAFSPKRTDGSFAPLLGQTGALPRI